MHVNDRRARLGAKACVLGDLLWSDRDLRSVTVHLHPTVHGGHDHQRLSAHPNLTPSDRCCGYTNRRTGSGGTTVCLHSREDATLIAPPTRPSRIQSDATGWTSEITGAAGIVARLTKSANRHLGQCPAGEAELGAVRGVAEARTGPSRRERRGTQKDAVDRGAAHEARSLPQAGASPKGTTRPKSEEHQVVIAPREDREDLFDHATATHQCGARNIGGHSRSQATDHRCGALARLGLQASRAHATERHGRPWSRRDRDDGQPCLMVASRDDRALNYRQ